MYKYHLFIINYTELLHCFMFHWVIRMVCCWQVKKILTKITLALWNVEVVITLCPLWSQIHILQQILVWIVLLIIFSDVKVIIILLVCGYWIEMYLFLWLWIDFQIKIVLHIYQSHFFCYLPCIAVVWTKHNYPSIICHLLYLFNILHCDSKKQDTKFLPI